MNLKQKAKEAFESTLSRVNPKNFIPDILKWNEKKRQLNVFDQTFNIDPDQPLYVIGAGKASPTMAQAIEEVLGDQLSDGMIIVPPQSEINLHIIKALEGSHPIPDEKSFNASEQLLRFINSIPEKAVVINLISGGTSSLFSVPASGLKQNNIAKVFKLLIESGASIQEVNTVRKTISSVKGGQVLERLKHTTLIDLIISDIPDDDLKYVGSGPTTAQDISYTDAIRILKDFDIWEKLSEKVRIFLNQKISVGANRKTQEIGHHHQWIVSSASTVADFTKQILQDQGFETTLVHPAWTGSIDAFEKHITHQINPLINKGKSKKAIVFYGECTVKVSGEGLAEETRSWLCAWLSVFRILTNPLHF